VAQADSLPFTIRTGASVRTRRILWEAKMLLTVSMTNISSFVRLFSSISSSINVVLIGDFSGGAIGFDEYR
jgi:hypothetical protein